MQALEMFPVLLRVRTTRASSTPRSSDGGGEGTPLVRLVKYEVVDVRDRDAGLARQGLDGVADGDDAKAEHAPAIHGKGAGRHGPASLNGQVPEMPGTFREATSGVVEKLIARGF